MSHAVSLFLSPALSQVTENKNTIFWVYPKDITVSASPLTLESPFLTQHLSADLHKSDFCIDTVSYKYYKSRHINVFPTNQKSSELRWNLSHDNARLNVSERVVYHMNAVRESKEEREKHEPDWRISNKRVKKSLKTCAPSRFAVWKWGEKRNRGWMKRANSDGYARGRTRRALRDREKAIRGEGLQPAL